MKSNWIKKLSLAGGLLCIAAALFLVGGNLAESSRAARTVQTAMEQLKPTALTPEKNADQPEQAEPLPETFSDPDSGLSVIELDGAYYMGYLSIPSLGLELPVQSSWSYPQLKVSPCRYKGTAEAGDLIVAAHNYDSHFGRLHTLNVGDAVYFTDVTGAAFSYTVAQVETLQPTAIEQMEGGEWDLTLFTCTAGGKARVTVRCTWRKLNK